MRYFYLLLTIGIIWGCSEQQKPSNETIEKEKTTDNSTNEWSYRTIRIEDKGWGYQLFRGSHLEINQQNIPAINGLHYFESDDKAELAAQLALSKIEQGFYPPTVEPAELDSIGAINLDSLQALIQP